MIIPHSVVISALAGSIRTLSASGIIIIQTLINLKNG
jgi:hypothetical protein